MNDPLTRLRSALESRYRIEREIGAGGMATVYVAQDLKHHRRVALKVLRPELAAIVGAERFLNEILLTANLQHPNILPLFDSGDADGFLYYVMPYVEGETLRDRLNREKQLGLEEALAIAKSVSSALQHAHERNILHRDIKPANILLHSGQALVADFGIALAVSHAGGARLTETGLSLGTPHYMSPEQAAGDRELDARSDVYSLGAVVYEMMVGEPPHRGSTAQAVVARILSNEPDPVAKHRPNVPAHVDAAIRRALSRTPGDRFRSGTEFVDALTGRVRLESPVTAPDPRPSRRVATAGWLVAGVAVALWAVVAARGWARDGTGQGQVYRTVIALPEDQRLSFGAGNSHPVAISPDGRYVVYVAEVESGTQLMLRPLDAFEATPIPGTAGATQPFFSPDGTQIGFVSGRALRRAGLDGGAPLTVTSIDGAPHGASWGDDGRIVFSVDGAGLFVVPAGGGEPAAIPLVVSPDGETPADTIAEAPWPQSLPGARHVIFSSDRGPWLADLATGEARLLVSGNAIQFSRYLPSGHVLYVEGSGAARLLPFDLKTLRVTGIPTTALSGVVRGMAGGANAIAVSDNGTAVYATATPGLTSLALLDRAGRETPLPAGVRGFRWPRLSPDGDRVVISGCNPACLIDLRRSGADPIPVGIPAVWSPDGARLMARVDSGGTVVEHRLDVVGQPRRLGRLPGASRFGYWLEDWSRDGRRVIGGVLSFSGRTEVRVLELERDSIPALVLETDGWSYGMRWSPDGTRFAYMSDETGAFEVYVAGYPEPGRPVRVTNGGGQDPHWTDHEIIYRNGHRIMAIDVRTEPTLELGEPRELFRADYNFHAGANNWDVSRDGQRFVMIKGDPRTTRELKVVVNWFAELGAGRAR